MILVAVLVLAVVLAGLVAALIVPYYRQSAQREEFRQAQALIMQHLDQAQDLIGAGRYQEAKKVLETAAVVAANHPGLAEQAEAIASLQAQPEIRLGANGYVKLDSDWLPEATGRAQLAARQRDDPRIIACEREAQAAQTQGRFAEGVKLCDQALALINAWPVKKHPRLAPITLLRDQLQTEATRVEMTAKGLVPYGERWVTPGEKLRLEQTAKGLVEYRGQWMSKDAALAAEQQDKGLVQYQGRWVTPGQKMEADGYVLFEGRWVRPAEQQGILAQREAAAKPGPHRLGFSPDRCLICGAARSANAKSLYSDKGGYGLCDVCGPTYRSAETLTQMKPTPPKLTPETKRALQSFQDMLDKNQGRDGSTLAFRGFWSLFLDCDFGSKNWDDQVYSDGFYAASNYKMTRLHASRAGKAADFTVVTQGNTGLKYGNTFYAVGMNAEDFMKKFGEPNVMDKGHLEYWQDGISVLVGLNGNISGFMILLVDMPDEFGDPRWVAAKAKTDRGIRAGATYKQVIQAHGKPLDEIQSRFRDSTPELLLPYPGFLITLRGNATRSINVMDVPTLSR